MSIVSGDKEQFMEELHTNTQGYQLMYRQLCRRDLTREDHRKYLDRFINGYDFGLVHIFSLTIKYSISYERNTLLILNNMTNILIMISETIPNFSRQIYKFAELSKKYKYAEVDIALLLNYINPSYYGFGFPKVTIPAWIKR